MIQLLGMIAAFLIPVGILVFVHEFGHFIMAKLVGVRVEVTLTAAELDRPVRTVETDLKQAEVRQVHIGVSIKVRQRRQGEVTRGRCPVQDPLRRFQHGLIFILAGNDRVEPGRHTA